MVEVEGEEPKSVLNKLILPEHIIELLGKDEQIIERVKNLKVNKYDEEILNKRLKNYRTLNAKNGYVVLIDFYKELKIDIT